MTKKPLCEDKNVLVAFLYGECTVDEQRVVEAHLAGCEACRTEFDALRTLRGQLAEWAPPDEVLDFRVVRGDGSPVAPARPWWRAPAWAFAAAAVLVLAAAAAIAHVEIRYDADGFVVRTGWSDGAAPAAPVMVQPAAATVEAAPWRDDLAALEASLRRELAAASASPAADVELLREVRALVAASEDRQQREQALQLAQLVNDVEQQRRADWSRIQSGFARLEDLTGAGVAQQREMLDYVIRVSGR
jgi:hypothetical protein